jgi:hypothetical protein
VESVWYFEVMRVIEAVNFLEGELILEKVVEPTKAVAAGTGGSKS